MSEKKQAPKKFLPKPGPQEEFFRSPMPEPIYPGRGF